MAKKYNTNFKWTDEQLAGAWKLHKWYKENWEDLKEVNSKDKRGSVSPGLNLLGSHFASFTIQNPKWIPRYEDFNVESKFWKKFAEYNWKGRGIKIVIDEAFYRRKIKEATQRENLYEARTIEDALGGGSIDYSGDYDYN
jgi:hypothetical protein